MQFKTSKIDVKLNFDNQCEIILTTQENRFTVAKWLKDWQDILNKGKELSVEIKEERKKRSLDANSYAWVIISKIADVIRSSKEEVYIEMLKKYGQREPQLLSVVADAVDMIYRATNNHCMVVGESELKGKQFKHLAILIGSSRYDTKQMSILIDGIISEAKELNIETLTPQEMALLKNSWGESKAS